MTGNQMDMFNAPPPARSDDTSQAAAKALEGSVVELRRRVLGAIRAAGTQGLTADEAAKTLRIGILTARPRCSELRGMKLIKDSGQRRPSSTSQSPMIVWVADDD